MVFSSLWSIAFIGSIIIFSIVIGLILGLNVSKKYMVKFSIVSIMVMLILIYLMNLYNDQLNLAIGSYNYLLLFVISSILIFIGYLINKSKDVNKVISLSYLSFVLIAFTCILSKNVLNGWGDIQITLLATCLFNSLVIAVFAIKKLKILSNSYEYLGKFYFIFGIYFLVVSLFIPNLVALDVNTMKPINIVSIESIILTIVLLAVVVSLGLLYNKKNTLFK
ncbi:MULTISPECIES: DUF2162 family putative transporter [unclassified Methanobrevibacter]|uniref:DUF2162 family putative transporter n=1 Tax=unclassified Methanobrevibacter TaxID=2638681 RepID=UPI002736F338|nr:MULTISPECIES: DUF2162 family putative transporter [unclassified Methanobrevibacter]